MDGARRNLTESVNNLYRLMYNYDCLNKLPDDIKEAFDEMAMDAGALNCISSDKFDDDFNFLKDLRTKGFYRE